MTKGATLQLLDNLGVLRIMRPTREIRYGTNALRIRRLLLQTRLDGFEALCIRLAFVSIQPGVESHSLAAFGTDNPLLEQPTTRRDIRCVGLTVFLHIYMSVDSLFSGRYCREIPRKFKDISADSTRFCIFFLSLVLLLHYVASYVCFDSFIGLYAGLVLMRRLPHTWR